MGIVIDAKKVLQELYTLISEESFTLYVKISMKVMAQRLQTTTKHLNLCIHYLIESGYLKGDFIYNHDENAIKEVALTPLAINKIENATL